MKRLYIFRRRFLLALFSSFLPVVALTVLCSIIPGESNLINTLLGKVFNTSNNLNSSQYGLQQIPYYIKDNDATLTEIINENYANNISLATFIKYKNDTINEDILSKRKENTSAFINDYYLGMSLANINGDIFGVIKYSTLAYHSCAVALNIINNIILQAIPGFSQMSITTVNTPISPTSNVTGSSNFLEILACLDSFPVSLLNFIYSVIVAFIISIMVMNITREKTNGKLV